MSCGCQHNVGTGDEQHERTVVWVAVVRQERVVLVACGDVQWPRPGGGVELLDERRAVLNDLLVKRATVQVADDTVLTQQAHGACTRGTHRWCEGVAAHGEVVKNGYRTFRELRAHILKGDAAFGRREQRVDRRHGEADDDLEEGDPRGQVEHIDAAVLQAGLLVQRRQSTGHISAKQ